MEIFTAKARHIHPGGFRSGQWAVIVGVVMVTPDKSPIRPCFMVEFPDGVVDYWPVSEIGLLEIEAIKEPDPDRPLRG